MIPAENAHLKVAAATNPGMRGKNNEDRYSVSAYRVSAKDPTPAILAVIADGVGGHRAGEIAADIAVEVISRKISSSDASQPAETLREAVIAASQAIYEAAASDPEKQGMSSTCACALVVGSRLYTASVGDSRIYLLRGSEILQLTVDHTWVQEVVESGALTLEQAHQHPNAHVIRRHLGSQQPVIPDLRLRLGEAESDEQAEANQGTRLHPGDLLVLCSDGLTDLVTKEEIALMLEERGPKKGLEGLVNLANARGGHDNITIVTLQVPAKKAVLVEVPPQPQSSWLKLGLSLAAVFMLGAALLAALFLSGSLPTVQPTPAASSTATLRTPTPLLPTVPVVQPLLTATASSPLVTTATAPLLPVLTPTLAVPAATYTPWPTNTPPAPVGGSQAQAEPVFFGRRLQPMAELPGDFDSTSQGK